METSISVPYSALYHCALMAGAIVQAFPLYSFCCCWGSRVFYTNYVYDVMCHRSKAVLTVSVL